MRILWTFAKLVLALVVVVPLSIIVLALTLGLFGALVGLAFVTLKLAVVGLLIWFLVRDEPTLGGWQSGVFSVTGKRKPAYHAFQLPLAEVSRRGTRTVLWGQVRPGSGARPYALQVFSRGRWRALGGTHRTGAGGTFRRTVTLPPTARVRLTSPVAGSVGPALVLR